MKISKRILAVVFAILMFVFVFAGCKKKDKAMPEPQNKPKVNVSTSIKNKDVWHSAEEEDMSTYGYCLVDLNQDGNFEIMASVNGGKYGDITRTKYYAVDENAGTITPIKHTSGESEADVTYGTKTCYKDTATGQYFYIFIDRVQPSIGEKYEYKVAVSYHNNEVTETVLAKKSEITDVDTEVTTVSYEDAQGNEITEQDYKSAAANTYSGFETYTVEFGGFKGYDKNSNEKIVSMSDAELEQLLQDSYSKFSITKQ